MLRLLAYKRIPVRCHAGKWQLAVDTNGDLYPCSAFAPREAYRMGSVFDGVDPKAASAKAGIGVPALQV